MGRRATFEITPEWHDWVVVERVLAGCDPGRELTHAERVDIASRLSVERAMRALRCCGTTVAKLRAHKAAPESGRAS